MDLRSLTFTIALALSSICQADQNWIGFKKSTDPAVPENIRLASASVYRIMFPVAPFAIVDLSTPENIEAAISKYESKKWEAIQLVYCRINSIRKCPVSSEMGGGSAFVVRNQNTLATNLHNLIPWLQAALANNPVDGASLSRALSQVMVPFALLDQNSALVLQPMGAGRDYEFELQLINDNPALYEKNAQLQSVRFALSDYVELHFSKPFPAKALEFETETGEGPFYVIGYPGPTHYFEALGGLDSDGAGQLISRGSPMAIEELSGPTSLFAANYLKRIDAAVQIGNSGGPALTVEGKVAGILRGGRMEADGKNFADFLQLHDLEGLKAEWKR